MKIWPHLVKSYTTDEVYHYAVKNQEWQMFRLTLKGLSTEDKLTKLDEFRTSKLVAESEPLILDDISIQRGQTHTFTLARLWEVPIDNYIQALHRGGLIKPTKVGPTLISGQQAWEVIR